MRFACGVVCLVTVMTVGAEAQGWNDAETLAIVRHATERRSERRTHTTFNDFVAHAQGFVVFSTELGEPSAPPKRLQVDQLALEVYWKAPGRSKQRVVGRRDQVDLPTGIQYHRDHLGIVVDNYPNRIFLGSCQEVCNVVHPLAPDAEQVYDYRLGDSLRIDTGTRDLRIVVVDVRPRNEEMPGAIGRLLVERGSGELVRLELGFTAATFRDPSVEDITIMLENALWSESHWLPQRQEIRIRRRGGALGVNAWGTITISLDISDYRFDTGLTDDVFVGSQIALAPDSVRDRYPWVQSLEEEYRAHQAHIGAIDLNQLQDRFRRVVSPEALMSRPVLSAGVPAVSDVIRYNRVEGLALGYGGRGQIRRLAWGLRGRIGEADRRFKAVAHVSLPLGRVRLVAEVGRDVVDFGDDPVGSGLVNSFSAQELGRDFGDYYLQHRATLSTHLGATPLSTFVRFGVERVESVTAAAAPASGGLQPNPTFGAGTFGFLVGGLNWRVPTGDGFVNGLFEGEYGRDSNLEYQRGRARIGFVQPWHGTVLSIDIWAGVGSANLPLHRTFAFGGRGTLPGEVFRAWGGRRVLAGVVSWTFRVPVPELALSRVVRSGGRLSFGPFVGMGWAGGETGQSWRSTDARGRTTVGVSLGWPYDLLRLDVGYSLRDERVRASFDVSRAFWGIL